MTYDQCEEKPGYYLYDNYYTRERYCVTRDACLERNGYFYGK